MRAQGRRQLRDIPQEPRACMVAADCLGWRGGGGAQDVPQVSPNLYGEGLTPYLEQIHFKSQSWEGGTAYALNLPPPC